jgi:hypothetical protein
MRTQIKMKLISSIFILIAILSCRFGDLDPRIIGVWEAAETQLTVREELSFMKFKFTQGAASVHLEIDENYNVNGRVGGAVFEGGTVQVNKDLLPPRYSGVGMTISCKLKGKIFDKDPTITKDVEFWIYYPIEDNSFLSELRFTEGGSQFPMTLFSFQRVD